MAEEQRAGPTVLDKPKNCHQLVSMAALLDDESNIEADDVGWRHEFGHVDGDVVVVRALVPWDGFVIVAIWWRGEILQLWHEPAGTA